MKKVVLFAIMAVCLFSCSSNEDKAKGLIKNKLKETLHDWNSYESVKFGTLDSIFSAISLEEKTDYIMAKSKFDSSKKQFDESIGNLNRYLSISPSSFRDDIDFERSWSEKMSDTMKIYSEILTKIENDFKIEKEAFVPKFIGWKMGHSFRSNNAMGAKVLGNYMFYFDPAITKIEVYEEIK